MGGAYNAHGGDEKFIENFSQKPKGKMLLGRLGIDGKVLLK
jgi:hypothetical protein